MNTSSLLKEAVTKLPSEETAKRLKKLLPENPFHIPSELARDLADKLSLSIPQLMAELTPIARPHALIDISDYSVGSCAMGLTGDLYLGVNLEFADQHIDQTVHSEQFVSTNALCHHEKGLKLLVVSSAPCGYCRQYLNELKCADELVVSVIGRGTMKLSELLPMAFGPADLNIEGGLMETIEPSISFDAPDELAAKALEAANSSYAPYSRCNSGVALHTRQGEYFLGWYAENAAFNPSMMPMQSAMIMLLAGLRTFADIDSAAIVERKSCKLTNMKAAEILLRTVAPQVTLHKYYGA